MWPGSPHLPERQCQGQSGLESAVPQCSQDSPSMVLPQATSRGTGRRSRRAGHVPRGASPLTTGGTRTHQPSASAPASRAGSSGRMAQVAPTGYSHEAPCSALPSYPRGSRKPHQAPPANGLWGAEAGPSSEPRAPSPAEKCWSACRGVAGGPLRTLLPGRVPGCHHAGGWAAVPLTA